jgi:hypothetical protein
MALEEERRRDGNADTVTVRSGGICSVTLFVSAFWAQTFARQLMNYVRPGQVISSPQRIANMTHSE